MGEKMFKTELETELEKAVEEKGLFFLEANKKQFEKFLKADLKKYPELDPENILNNPETLSDVGELIEDITGEKDYTLPKRFEEGKLNNFEKATIMGAYGIKLANKMREMADNGVDISRMQEALFDVLQYYGDESSTMYKIKTVCVDDITLSYRAEIKPEISPKKAYSEGSVMEEVSVKKKFDNRLVTLVTLYKKSKEKKIHNFSLINLKDAKDLLDIDTKKLRPFTEYDKKNKNSKKALLKINSKKRTEKEVILAWEGSKKLLPELKTKQFIEDLLKLIGV